MAQQITVYAPDFDDLPGDEVEGTGYIIGDGFALTAGHVVFDYDHAFDSSIDLASSLNIETHLDAVSNTVVLDYNEYQSLYLAALKSDYHTAINAGLPAPRNEAVEADAVLRANDGVLISHAGTVGASDAGLVVFLNPSDMVNLAASLNSGAAISRVGNKTGTVTGAVAAASNGALTFSVKSIPGDSGGPYILSYNGKSYVLGTQSATDASHAYGTYFSKSSWDAINSAISLGQSGNVTASEPQNMIVGTNQSDGDIYGSYRADLILGRGGADKIHDGDSANSSVWANDTLVGGAGSDTFYVGKGADTIWGGDENVETQTSGDTDTVDYSSIASPVKITYDGSGSFPAITVDDGTGETDTLHSIEKIVGTTGRDRLAIVGNIVAGNALTVDANGGQSPNPADTIDVSHANAAVHVAISATGSGAITDASTNGQIDLVGFHTGIVGSDFDDQIDDRSSGHKQITGGSGNDIISIGGDGGTVLGGDGDDQLTGSAGDDVLDGGWGTNTIDGGAGSDKIISEGQNDVIHGGDGNDYIKDRGAWTQVEGGAGNDVIDLEGSDGSGSFRTTIKFGYGDGHDVVLPMSQDHISLIDLSGVSKSDISFIWSNTSSSEVTNEGTFNGEVSGTVLITGDLTIRVNSTGDTITLSNQMGFGSFQGGTTYTGFSDIINTTFSLPIEFSEGMLSDGDFFNSDDPGHVKIPVTFADTSSYRTAFADYQAATAADLQNATGTAGDDNLWGGPGDDAINSGAGNDTILSSGGNDVVDGGDGSDTLVLTGSQSQFAVSSIDDTSVTLSDWAGVEGNTTIRSVETVSYLTNDVDESVRFGTEGSDIISDSNAGIIHGGAGNDTLTGGDGGVYLFGGTGDDLIYGGSGDDTITGGAGNDQLAGGAGYDSYLWSQGDGEDVITDDAASGDANYLDLINVTEASVTATKSGNDLVLSVASGGGVTIRNQFSSTGTGGIDEIDFGDGAYWDRAAIEDHIQESSGGGGQIETSNPLSDLTVYRSNSIDILIPSDTFSYPNGDAPIYTAALADGSALPSWLSLDGDHLVGTVPDTAIGILDVRVTATDGSGSASSVFKLTTTVQTGDPITSDQWQLVTDGNDRIFDNGPNTGMSGFGGDDVITLDAWNVSADGGDGNDVFEMFGNDDNATGGNGADTFLFDSRALVRSAPNPDAWATINDFVPGEDRIGILNGTGGVASYADLQAYMSQSGSDVLIQLQGLPTITLSNVSLTNLSAADFLFSEWASTGASDTPPPIGVVPYPTTTNTVDLYNGTGDFTAGNDRVLGNGAGNVEFHAGAGDDYITTDGWNVSAFGDQGNDVFEINGTVNTIVGGPGYDYYVFDSAQLMPFSQGDAWATIADYADGIDKIVFRNGTGGMTDFNDLGQYMAQDGNDVTIALPDLPTIRLTNVNLAQLDASDFIFEEDGASSQARAAIIASNSSAGDSDAMQTDRLSGGPAHVLLSSIDQARSSTTAHLTGIQKAAAMFAEANARFGVSASASEWHDGVADAASQHRQYGFARPAFARV